MDFVTAIKSVYSKYVTFSGRAQRSEFWWFILFYYLVVIGLTIVDIALFGTTTSTDGGFEGSTDTPIFSGLFMLATLLPAISVLVRRLHDTDRTGWWYWIVLIPIAGIIVLIVFLASKGTDGANRYGSDPLGGDDDGPPPADFTKSSIPKAGS